MASAFVFFVVAMTMVAGAASRARAASQHADEIRQQGERGPVHVELVVTPASPVIGDILVLDFEVRAKAGVEVLMPEFGEALGRFEIVDFAPSQEQDASGDHIARQRYRLQPARSGHTSIPPLRIEFVDRREGQTPAPEGEDAYELLTERIALDITPILAEDAPLDLRPAISDLGSRNAEWAPWWVGVLGVVVIALALAPFGWRLFFAARARQRSRSAYEVARTDLDRLLEAGRPDAGTMDAFYVRLSLIVRTYLEDRFRLRSPELTTQEFLSEMGRSPDLARSHQKLLREFLEAADLVKFAGHRPAPEEVAQSIAAAERFLEETRESVPLSDATGSTAAGRRDV
jgi:hypothetical protein